MKETEAITQISDKLLAVPVPLDASNFHLWRDEPNEPTYISFNRNGGTYNHGFDITELPQPEHCKILGVCDPKEIGFDPTDYIICGGEHDSNLWYMDYTSKEGEDQEWFDNPADSFRSLLQSKGLDSGHYLILEKL